MIAVTVIDFDAIGMTIILTGFFAVLFGFVVILNRVIADLIEIVRHWRGRHAR